MLNVFSDDPRYLAWIRENIGGAGWEFSMVERVRDGVVHYLEGWSVVTRDGTGSIIPSKRVSAEFIGEGELLFERCDVAALLMERAFPELTLVRGYFRDSVQHDGYWMYHCWLVDSEGRKVDPTGRQFDRTTAEYDAVENEFVWGVEVDSYRSGQYVACIAEIFALEGCIEKGLTPEGR